MTAEAGLRARILAAIRQTWPRRTGVSLWGRPASAASGPGHPDIGGVVRSRPIALEIKKGKGKPTPLQEQRIRDLRYAGCYAWIVRSPDEAVHAVYWTAKGWTRPMSNEPLDLNAWLNGSPAQAPAPEYAPAAEAPPAAAEIPFLMDNDTGDTLEAPITEHTPDDGHFNFEPLSSPFTEAHHHAVEVVTGRILPPASEDANLDEQPEKLPAFNVSQLDDDLRTVGDRVTLVWERVGEFHAVLQAIYERQEILLGRLDDLFGLINDDSPPPAPKPTRRRKKAEPEAANGTVVEEVPATAPATDDIPF